MTRKLRYTQLLGIKGVLIPVILAVTGVHHIRADDIDVMMTNFQYLDRSQKLTVINELESRRTDRSIRTLASMLVGTDDDAAAMASASLSHIGRSAVNSVILLLKEKVQPEMVPALALSRIASCLRGMGDVGVKSLITAIHYADTDATMRANIALVLGMIGGESARQALLDPLLLDPHRAVHAYTVHALGVLGDPRSLEGIVASVKEEAVLLAPVRLPWAEVESKAILFADPRDPLYQAVVAIELGGSPWISELKRLSTANSDPYIRDAATYFFLYVEKK